ncbi:isoaspartyl peptidase/L-asparaginase [Skeletonema marinoi]|uniref:Isoaspartyl peptidase/L-asparaginase n=1 Tax=Skeletonema marinoi TaxID=267567 RepID=A0AAD8Y4I2_9STRA|nr:isoaspartyl peptidase/L-asparaginase [Skeletonema marinoi]
MPQKRVVLAVHGGAGIILRSALTPEMVAEYRSALQDALSAGYAVLDRSSRDDATNSNKAAVRCMEDCTLFNAGKGSVFAHDGHIRCDASIMSCSFDKAAYDSRDASCDKAEDDIISSDKESSITTSGAIAGVGNIQNPISLAKAVMIHTPHVMLIGKGAEDFARQLPKEARRRWKQLVNVRESEKEEQQEQTQQVMKVQLDHSSTSQQEGSDMLRDKKFGTVGCIALYQPDSNENTYQLASATSTGGMTNNVITALATHQSLRLEYKYGYDGTSSAADNALLKKALEEVIFGTLMSEDHAGEQGGDGGAIVLDKDGNFAADMNCPGMYHGWVYEDGEMETSIFWDERVTKQ